MRGSPRHPDSPSAGNGQPHPTSVPAPYSVEILPSSIETVLDWASSPCWHALESMPLGTWARRPVDPSHMIEGRRHGERPKIKAGRSTLPILNWVRRPKIVELRPIVDSVASICGNLRFRGGSDWPLPLPVGQTPPTAHRGIQTDGYHTTAPRLRHFNRPARIHPARDRSAASIRGLDAFECRVSPVVGRWGVGGGEWAAGPLCKEPEMPSLGKPWNRGRVV